MIIIELAFNRTIITLLKINLKIDLTDGKLFVSVFF